MAGAATSVARMLFDALSADRPSMVVHHESECAVVAFLVDLLALGSCCSGNNTNNNPAPKESVKLASAPPHL